MFSILTVLLRTSYVLADLFLKNKSFKNQRQQNTDSPLLKKMFLYITMYLSFGPAVRILLYAIVSQFFFLELLKGYICYL